MKVKPVEQSTWSQLLGFASVLAVLAASLFHHGFYGYFGIHFWEYIGLSDIVTTSLGVLLLLGLSIVGLVGVNAFSYYMVVKKTRDGEDKKTRRSEDFYVANLYGSVILGTIIWIGTKTYLAHDTALPRAVNMISAIPLALPVVLSGMNIF